VRALLFLGFRFVSNM